ncbi:MAG TPA: GxGYxYP domain-containing protein [Bryobacteraceae bacterium]|nr:GxGYxYP domain-containing protein [Bryobacteraceae bacterium]
MKVTRRNFLGTAAGVSAYAGLSALVARGQVSSSGQGLIWPPNQALPTFLPVDYLEAGNIESLSGDQQLLLTTLQGIVNRRKPRLYWFKSGDNTDQIWLGTFNVPNTVANDPFSLLDKYRDEIRGAIVYDPANPHTINAATSLAGVMDAVVASADLANQYQLPIVFDFRGRFSNSKLDVYNWVLDNYWDQLTHRLLTGISPATPGPTPGVTWTTLLEQTTHVHDSSNKNTYTVDLTPFLGGQAVWVRFQDYFQNDGWGPSVQQVTVLADGNAIASFQPGTAAEQPFLYEADNSAIASGGWRFADSTTYFIYQISPPAGTKTLTLQVLMWNQYLVTATTQPPLVYTPFTDLRDYIVATQSFVFWLDPEVPSAEADLFTQILQKVAPDTPYLGWFVDGREVQGVTMLSQNASFVGAADLSTNLSVHGGIRVPIRPFQPPAPVAQLQNKVYVTITMSEGDNLQYCEHRLRTIWDDPNRGKVPLNWSVSPLLLDAAPGILYYYQSTQTPNDFWVAGPSGAGYTYPGAWPAADLPSYTQRTGEYMARTGMNVIFALNHPNGTVTNFTNAVAADYVQYVRGLLGILGDWTSSSSVTAPDGLPVITEIGITTIAQGQAALAAATKNWSANSPLFVAISAIAWNLAPTDINNLVASLGSQYEVVRADVFFELLRQGLGAS